MRIVVDLQACQTSTRNHGIGRYAMALTKAMLRRLDGHEILLVLNGNFSTSVQDLRQAFTGLLPRQSILTYRTPAPCAALDRGSAWRLMAAELVKEYFVATLRPDIFHIPGIFDPDSLNGNAVTSVGEMLGNVLTSVTIHDLIPLCYPQQYLNDNLAKSWYHKKIKHLKKAGCFLAVSDYTKNEAIDLLGLPPANIVNTMEACDERFRVMDRGELERLAPQLRSQYHLKQKFIMYAPSGYDFRKNIQRLIKAYAMLPNRLRGNYQLVLVGKAGEVEKRQIGSWMQAAKLNATDIVTTGYVKDAHLVALYNLADLFVFPSLHEGFGLPALEAMSCGAPVIGSNRTSIPEVIGRADALFDPFDCQAIAKKITAVLTDDNFCGALRRHGVQQAGKFSWDKSARITLDAFEELHRRRIPKADEELGAQGNLYKKLLTSLARIPKHPVGPSDHDLIVTANCIDQNQISA